MPRRAGLCGDQWAASNTENLPWLTATFRFLAHKQAPILDRCLRPGE
jgi:hypothetical protein